MAWEPTRLELARPKSLANPSWGSIGLLPLQVLDWFANSTSFVVVFFRQSQAQLSRLAPSTGRGAGGCLSRIDLGQLLPVK